MNGTLTRLSSGSAGLFSMTSSEPLFVYRFSIRSFLAQIGFCAMPAILLLGLGRAEMAGKVFWPLLGLLLARGVFLGRRDELLALLIATAPFLSLLRSYLFYNVIIAVFGLVAGYYLVSGTTRLWGTIRRYPLFTGVAGWVAVYYGLSFFNTRDYAINLRLFEFAFTILGILLLSRHKVLLGAALLGNLLSAWMVGAAMLPHMGTSERLGIIAVEGRLLGNPGQLGLPLATGFLALVLENGRWVNLERRPLLRWSMTAVTVGLLALTTSRASWLVAFIGVLVLFVFGRRQRMKLMWLALVGVIGISVIMVTPYGGALRKGWERTFGENYSIRKKTSGRSDQWLVSKYVFTRSIDSMIHGYRPGRGPQTYAKFSPEVPGVRYGVGRKVALHSLFMQMLVETGIVGLGCFLVWLLAVLIRVWAHMAENGILPFACFFGYFFTVVSVSGSDINSGILLGMALIGTAAAGSSVRGGLQPGVPRKEIIHIDAGGACHN